jgi:hypothetical protein
MRLRVDIALFWAYKNGSKTRFTTRFHSFTDGNIPSVCDYQFISDLFTDVFIDRIRPSAFLLLVIPHSIAISVGNTKKPFADGFTDGIFAPKKKVSHLKYTDGFLFRRWYRDLPTDTYRRYICRWVFEIPTEYIRL